MSETPTDLSVQDSRFEEAVAQFLRLREEGGDPNPEQFLQRFPDLAGPLHEYFAGLALFQNLAPHLAPLRRRRGGPSARQPTDTRGPSTEAYPPHLTGFRFLAAPERPDEIGRLGPYRLLKVLGAGGMGVVFQAEDMELLRLVALKVIKPQREAGASARQRFLQEARGNAAVTHDHIVTIYRVGEDRGVPYLAMQLLHGESLEARLKRDGKPPVREVLRIGREIAEGLTAAHARGLIHRDIKPANVWLEAPGGRVKILDFGLVRMTESLAAAVDAPTPSTTPPAGDGRLTEEGSVLGTPAFMAPEQAAGQEVDARADLFSLGCVLYALCTKRLPFPKDDRARPPPLPPAQLNPAIPTELSDLVLRLLARRPADRPRSAREVVEQLAALEQKPTRRRQPRRMPFLAALVGVSLLLLALLGVRGGRLLFPEQVNTPVTTDAKPQPAEAAAPLPPRVSLQFLKQRGNQVKLRAIAAAGDRTQLVTALRLLLDGQTMPGDKGLTEFDPALDLAEAEWTITLLPGEHRLAVLARSPDTSAVSEAVTVDLAGPEEAADLQRALPRAFLKLAEQKGDQVKVWATAVAVDPKQPVTNLRLLVDGRPLPNREGWAEFPTGRDQAEAEWTVRLPNGTHRLLILAHSPNASSVSESILVAVHDGNPARSSVLSVLAVGITDHRDKDLTRLCAANDARDIGQAFKDNSRRLFGTVNSTVLIDKQATRPAIREWLSQCRRTMKPDDVLVLFFAGYAAKDGTEVYLLTAETDRRDLAGTGLSGAELRAALAEMPCRVLVLLDAGTPAAGGKEFRPAVDDLARTLTNDQVGVAFMSAAMGKEQPAENPERMHGLLRWR